MGESLLLFDLRMGRSSGAPTSSKIATIASIQHSLYRSFYYRVSELEVTCHAGDCAAFM